MAYKVLYGLAPSSLFYLYWHGFALIIFSHTTLLWFLKLAKLPPYPKRRPIFSWLIFTLPSGFSLNVTSL